MIYVGIDIAKETHVAAAVDSDGVIIIEPFSFTNNHEGFSTPQNLNAPRRPSLSRRRPAIDRPCRQGS